MSSMTDVSIGMVSYYNPLAMYRQSQHQQPNSGATGAQQQLSQQAQQQAEVRHVAMQQQAAAAAAAAAASVDSNSTQQYWYGYPHGHLAHAPHHHHHHHQTSAPQQYLDHAADVLAWPHHPHYPHHLQYQHQQAAYQQHHQQQQQQAQLSGAVSEWSGDESSTHLHQQHQAVGTGEPSPPITVSGSEISSPGTPSSPSANNNNNSNSTNNNNNSATSTPMKPAQIRSPFEWMNKPSYQSQPNPACNVTTINTGSVAGLHELCTLDALGKTRTKDKYRVVYTDHQRLELEKEFHYSRYITIRRKAELAANLALSERQVKIWFQNRRAKERKQSKKREESKQEDVKPGDMGVAGGMASLAALGGMGGMLGGLMHNGGSPPLSLGPPPHGLTALGQPTSSLHAHTHQHAHSHAVLGL